VPYSGAGEPLQDLIADCCLAVRGAFDPRSLCHVLWGLARLGYLDEPFYLEFVPVVGLMARVAVRCGVVWSGLGWVAGRVAHGGRWRWLLGPTVTARGGFGLCGGGGAPAWQQQQPTQDLPAPHYLRCTGPAASLAQQAALLPPDASGASAAAEGTQVSVNEGGRWLQGSALA
jgi:hypothetical protein